MPERPYQTPGNNLYLTFSAYSAYPVNSSWSVLSSKFVLKIMSAL